MSLYQAIATIVMITMVAVIPSFSQRRFTSDSFVAFYTLIFLTVVWLSTIFVSGLTFDTAGKHSIIKASNPRLWILILEIYEL
jgi:hypothetical protein